MRPAASSAEETRKPLTPSSICSRKSRAVGRLFQSVERILREGQERGELRGDFDPDVASQMFIGGLEIAVTARVLDVTRVGEGESEDEYCARVARTVVELFLNGVSAGGVT